MGKDEEGGEWGRMKKGEMRKDGEGGKLGRGRMGKRKA